MKHEFEGCTSEINSFPRCAPLAVFNHVFLPVELRGRGVGTRAHRDRLKKAEEEGFTYALCTVSELNKIELKILAVFRWTRLVSFLSKDKGHYVYLYGRSLSEKGTYMPSVSEMAAYDEWEKSITREET